MAKEKTGTLIALAALGIGAYMWYKDKQQKEAAAAVLPPVTPVNTGVVPPPVSPQSGYDYPIITGRYSNEAKLLQKEVGATQDGIIGPKTVAAVRVFLPDFPNTVLIQDRANLDAIIKAIQTARATIYNQTVNA